MMAMLWYSPAETRAMKGDDPTPGTTGIEDTDRLGFSFLGVVSRDPLTFPLDDSAGAGGKDETAGAVPDVLDPGVRGRGVLGGPPLAGDGAAFTVVAGVEAEVVVAARANLREVDSALSSSFPSLFFFSNESNPGLVISPLSVLPSCPVLDRPHEKSLPLAVNAREWYAPASTLRTM
jgi:hypothetical protein